MKKILLLAFIVGYSVGASAQVVDEPYAVPDALVSVLDMLSGVPLVGTYLILLMKYIAFIGAFFTVLSTAFVAVGKMTAQVLNLAGAADLSDKVEAFGKRVAPWLKFLSIYNVKHPLPSLIGANLPPPPPKV
jgi:hypothetical protein